jgi:hypothetical protein
MMMRPPSEVPEYQETARKQALAKLTESRVALCDDVENGSEELLFSQ